MDLPVEVAGTSSSAFRGLRGLPGTSQWSPKPVPSRVKTDPDLPRPRNSALPTPERNLPVVKCLPGLERERPGQPGSPPREYMAASDQKAVTVTDRST